MRVWTWSGWRPSLFLARNQHGAGAGRKTDALVEPMLGCLERGGGGGVVDRTDVGQELPATCWHHTEVIRKSVHDFLFG